MSRACIAVALIGSLGAGEAALRETPTHLLLTHPALELRIDRASGQLASLTHRPSGLLLLGNGERLSPVDLRADGGYVGAAGASVRWRYAGHEVAAIPGGTRLSVRARAGDWEVAVDYELGARDALLARRATFRYLGGGTPIVRGSRFGLAGAACGEPADAFYEVLSRWPPEQFPMGTLVEGRRRGGTGSHATSRFVAVHNRRRKLSLLAAFYSESEGASLAVLEHRGTIDVGHYHQVLDRPTRGRAIATGTQYVLVVEGDWDTALRSCQSFYDRIGVRVPPAMAERGARSIVYSCHPGGTIDSGFRDVGGIRNLQRTLPRLQELGVNVVWMLPFWEGRVYAPVRYDRLQANWADEEGLRAFVSDAHSRGMKVLLDLIPHGPRLESGLHERHRDWVSTTEGGEMLLWWGCLGCDYAHPGWQRFMAEHAADWVRRADIDGYRVDCAAGGPPNWAAADGRRPSQSGLWGAMGILRQSRAAMEKIKRPIYLLPEAEGVPLNTVGEFTYPWTWFFQVLPALREMPAEDWVPRAMRWLQNHQLTLPRGASHIWFLENHDTPRAEMVYGPGTHRALLALCAFLRGAPFLYHEQQVGYSPYLRKLYAIRRSSDLFTVGEANYVPLVDDPRVFCITRRLGDRVAYVLINLSGETIRSLLRVPRREGLVLRDLAGDAFGRVPLDGAIELAPSACSVLLVEAGRPRPRAAAPYPKAHRRRRRDSAIEQEGTLLSLCSLLGEVVSDGRRGGAIHALSLGHQKESWVAGYDLVEGPRKLWVGQPACRLSRATIRTLALSSTGMRAADTAFTARLNPFLRADVRYSIDPRNRIEAHVGLMPDRDLVRTRGALTTILRFPRADAWAVRTAEGPLADDHVIRRRNEPPTLGRYWHATTHVLWESRLQPSHPDLGKGPVVLVYDRDSAEYLGLSASASPPEFLQNMVLAERDGDHEQLTLRIEWLRGDRPVTLRAGQTYWLTLRMTYGRDHPSEHPPGVSVPKDAPRLQTGRGNYVVSNDHYCIELARSAGGNIRRLTLKGRDQPVIDHSRIYTDYGLYGTWRDPLGREHKTHAHNENDIEPDVELRRDGDRLTVGFTSFFRHPGHGGRSLLSPRMQYRLRYTFDHSPTIRVEAAVRPHMTVRQAKAFLAHTLRFPAASRWAVASPDGGFTGARAGAKGRLWQSAGHRLGAPRLAIETPGGSAVIADLAPGDALQNLFPHASPGSATVFLAWLDGQPTDVGPHWRTVSYTLTVAPGKLDEVVKDLSKLKTWPLGTHR